MSSQFREMYGNDSASNLKESLKALANSNLSDDQIIIILKSLLSDKKQSNNSNSQFADH